MEIALRKEFNGLFSESRYQKHLHLLQEKYPNSIGFRLSETPVFLSRALKNELLRAGDSIIHQFISDNLKPILKKAIPKNYFVPGNDEHPHIISIDFGLCWNEKQTNITPKLIELQAFPSLFAYQLALGLSFKEIYPEILSELDFFLDELTPETYIQKLRKTIIGEHDPTNVVLLEIYPEKQKTLIDFLFTKEFLGIETVCYSKIIKEGKNLFYIKDDKKIPIKRIYNRVIFDELEKLENFSPPFSFQEELNVEWMPHPNWFFKVSKYLLPYLKDSSVPKAFFAHEFPASEILGDYVLKPLYSFAGQGVVLHPKYEDISLLVQPENYILQRKVQYANFIEDIYGDKAKAEIRLLYVWPEDEPHPTPMINLVRMSKSEMINVAHNKTAIWTGSSIAFFEK